MGDVLPLPSRQHRQAPIFVYNQLNGSNARGMVGPASDVGEPIFLEVRGRDVQMSAQWLIDIFQTFTLLETCDEQNQQEQDCQNRSSGSES